MRVNLTMLILIAFIMQVSASSFAQKITLSERNVPLVKVFDKIRDQSGYDFLVTKSTLKEANPVNISIKDASLEDVLTKIFAGQPIEYSIKGKMVVVTPKKSSIIESVSEKISGLFQQEIEVLIYLKDDKGNPLPGGSATILSNKQLFRSTENGAITFKISKDEKVLFSYIGFKNKEITIKAQPDEKGYSLKTVTVTLEQDLKNLKEVEVVSTGLQEIAKERATGSFEVITAKQLQHSNDPNLLKRLEGITTSVVFNNQVVPTNSSRINSNSTSQFINSPLANMTIRGKNTLTDGKTVMTGGVFNQSGIPLVVIDGIANPYSIDLVNPDDVESVTILKDAAAAAIWGSRAANGVIVIKTKRGKYTQPTRIYFNSNINITEKMDLFYKKTMSVSDFIDAEIFAYSKTNPTSALADPILSASGLINASSLKSPVFEIMNQLKLSKITPAEASAQLDALRGNDIRNDYTKYFLRNAVNQNYSLNISGGSKKVNYSLSGGYNKTLNNTKNSGSDRGNLNYNINAKLLSNLELSGSINYSLQRNNAQTSQTAILGYTSETFFPYTKLADDQGNHLEVPKAYRPVFVQLLENSSLGSKLLSLRYKPLDDINESDDKLKTQNININLGTNYKILPWLIVDLRYNYNNSNKEEIVSINQNSFYMRDLINRFTNRTTSARQIPLGGVYQPGIYNNNHNQTLRGQLNIEKNWNNKNELSAIVGTDIFDSYSISKTGDAYYGYDPKTLLISNRIDMLTKLPQLYSSLGQTTAQIPFVKSPGISEYKNRTLSVFSAATYTYDKRYGLSASIRKDGNSDFGAGTNKTGTPYWSVGTLWNINEEKFYKLDWLPNLRLRTTFGYNGNVNPRTVGRTRITIATGTEITGFSSAFVGSSSGGITVANRNLRPEKTGILNLGLDFGIKKNRVSGSFEYYNKQTVDLITNNIVDPTLGYTIADFNTANTQGYGFNFMLNTINIRTDKFTWNSNFLLTHERVKVTKLYTASALTAEDVINNVTYNEGYDLTRLFAYRWGGLDPETGDPRGYVDGKPARVSLDGPGGDNMQAISSAPLSEAKYFGSAVPVYYGSFRNSFTYGQLTVSANVIYKLGYYFRRSSSQFGDVLQYGSLFNKSAYPMLQSAEYERRWQKPGDELQTNVPSLVYATTSGNSRDQFYALSEINVQKGDHIRLQEINLSYSIKGKSTWFIKNPRIYANISNLGIIWRANKLGIDPDINDYPNPRTYGFGFSTSF